MTTILMVLDMVLAVIVAVLAHAVWQLSEIQLDYETERKRQDWRMLNLELDRHGLDSSINWLTQTVEKLLNAHIENGDDLEHNAGNDNACS